MAAVGTKEAAIYVLRGWIGCLHARLGGVRSDGLWWRHVSVSVIQLLACLHLLLAFHLGEREVRTA